MNRKILIPLFLILSLFTLHAGELGFFETSSVYIPEGWGVLGSERDKVTFSDPSKQAYLQIKRYPGNSFKNAKSIYEGILLKLGAKGEGDGFKYETRDAWFGNVEFSASGYHYRGFVACIDGQTYDYVVLSFSLYDAYGKFHDFILSSIDSFALDDSGRLSPGPVSQYYYPFPAPEREIGYIHVGGEKVLYTYDRNELEASQVVVEREARILASYTKSKLREAAWSRYYKILYRDSFLRLERVSGILSRYLDSDFLSLDPLKKSSVLLSWIQGYEYYRTGTLSDFLSPLSCLMEEKGDCDSKALLYVILLHHYGIDAILMVSSVYSHSLAGVDVSGEGARFNFDGKGYLVAETTDEVKIGLIDSKMADPAKWMGIAFP